MRTVTMCFSILQFSRSGVPRFAGFWRGGFHSLSSSSRNNSNFRVVGSKTYGLEGGYRRRWIRRPASTKAEGRSKTADSNKSSNIRNEILEETVSATAAVNVNVARVTELRKIEYCDIQQNIAENKGLVSLVTIVVFDIETTGFSRENDRIIEIALRDLSGGENSTFQTLVNPQKFVANHHVHGITSRMVNRPDVPRMEDLIPILLKYVRSRQKPEGIVLFVAHNARVFDVPFLKEEFNRCNYVIPTDWHFMDTLPLSRQVVKAKGQKVSLQALREYYKIESVGSAHRAMADVNLLSIIFQRLTFDLKMSVSNILEISFAPTELNTNKKKKDSS
ncbi:exonuclease DPD1, chloroplastic/mitochondrial isoform X2 [Punica granatum]|nr:exonuclease DPD1, chloroplastic/mitochondrial isoform X2 [Punica granatum]XP_031373639.1 exonuclease DPD1, chloroplastic/mitochondrial isoform X2 [Punica granatum]XP_031373648.1 exonuclease DPD1, chloroplastic/mitochondrial isoform X2 [Punica granatum]PKI76155.1 hypothetical protein CRG98_003516 [Punica granatum]